MLQFATPGALYNIIVYNIIFVYIISRPKALCASGWPQRGELSQGLGFSGFVYRRCYVSGLVCSNGLLGLSNKSLSIQYFIHCLFRGHYNIMNRLRWVLRRLSLCCYTLMHELTKRAIFDCLKKTTKKQQYFSKLRQSKMALLVLQL